MRQSAQGKTFLGFGRYRLCRAMFVLFFLLMVLEGAVRKWIAPSLGVPLQVLRDLIPSLALIVFMMSRPPALFVKSGLPPKAVLQALVLYVAVSIISMLVSGQTSMVIPILGLRTHFAYVPIALLVPVLFSRDEFDGFLRKCVALGIPVCALAVYQSTQPQESWINIYGTGEAAGALYGENNLVRAAGTFSYITGMGYFAQSVAAISYYLMMTTSGRRMFLASIGFVAAIMGGFSTGSRAVIFGLLIQVVLMTLISTHIRKRIGRRIVAVTTMGLLSIVSVIHFAGDQVDAFIERTQSVSSDSGWRITDALTEWVDILIANPLGRGIGSGHQQAAAFIGGQGGFGGANSLPESELSRVAWELGVLGFLIFILFRITSYIYVYQSVMKHRGGAQSAIAALALSTVLLLIPGAIYSPMANALFWVSLGILGMLRLERITQAHRQRLVNYS